MHKYLKAGSDRLAKIYILRIRSVAASLKSRSNENKTVVLYLCMLLLLIILVVVSG